MQDAHQYSVMSVTVPEFKPRHGEKIAWLSPLIWASDAVEKDPVAGAKVLQLISGELTRRGYQMVSEHHQADYIIGAAIVDGDSERSEELRNFFQLFPSIGTSGSKFDKSIFYVGLINSEDQVLLNTPGVQPVVLWRSSIKAYVLGDKLEPELRKQRMQAFIHRLMASFP